MYIFLSQIYFEIVQYKLKQILWWNFFLLESTLLCKKKKINMLQYYNDWNSNMDTLEKEYNVTTFLASLNVFSSKVWNLNNKTPNQHV